MNKPISRSMYGFRGQQQGMVLLISLIFLLLLTMVGVSSMQNASLQEKMAKSVTVRNESFQKAEAVLRLGETKVVTKGFTSAKCSSAVTCLPPPESTVVTTAGANSSSGVTWESAGGGLYAIQNLGTTTTPIIRPSTCNSASTVTLYRITAVAIQGPSRTVLESIYGDC